jgi:hypothetical protein
MNKYFENTKTATSFASKRFSERNLRMNSNASADAKLVNYYKPVGIAALTAAALYLNAGAKDK